MLRAALRQPYDAVKWREVDSLSGGQQKRLVLESRWFAASFDRFLVFAPDGTVSESAVPVWE